MGQRKGEKGQMFTWVWYGFSFLYDTFIS